MSVIHRIYIKHVRNKAEWMASDVYVSRFVVLFFIIYIVFYGFFITKGVRWNISWGYLSILLPIFLVDAVKSLVETFFKCDFVRGTEKIKKISVIIPTYNGGGMLAEVLADLTNRFDPSQIIVSSNGSTDNTADIARGYKVRLIDTIDPIGKVAAINLALDLVKTPYVLIMDDDTFVGDETLPTSLLDEGYEAIAFRVMPRIGNFITKIQSYEYRKSMDIGKCFHNKYGTVQNISGAIGLFKIEELRRQVKIHTSEFSGEDLQRTLLVHLNRKAKGVIITDGTIETDVPNSLLKLYRQRIFGWNPGMYSNVLNYLKLLIMRDTPFFLRYDAFYNLVLVICGDPLRFISFPVLLFYPGFIPIYYLTYILLETVTYVVSKAKEPYWVVLIYPLYGLFNFITRIVSLAVFLHRRLSVIIGKSHLLDDYKKVGVVKRLISSTAINILVLGVFVTIAFAEDPTIGSRGKNFVFNIAQYRELENAVTENDSEFVIRPIIIVKADSGDGVWRISAKAIDQYTANNGIVQIPNKNSAILKLVSNKRYVKVFKDDKFVFNKDDVANALASI